MTDTALYNTALHECFKRLYSNFTFDDIDNLLLKMKENNIDKNMVTYHEILKIYARCADLNKCMRYFNDMVDVDRIQPTVTTFNRLLKCCVYAYDVNNAKEVLRLMRNDFNVSPDIYTYRELISLYSQVTTKYII